MRNKYQVRNWTGNERQRGGMSKADGRWGDSAGRYWALWLQLATVSLKGRFAFETLASQAEFRRIPHWQIDICSLMLPVGVNGFSF